MEQYLTELIQSQQSITIMTNISAKKEIAVKLKVVYFPKRLLSIIF